MCAGPKFLKFDGCPYGLFRWYELFNFFKTLNYTLLTT